MITKNNLNILKLDIKKLCKLKENHSKIIDKYENDIFPNTIQNYYKYKLLLILTQIKEYNKENELEKEFYTIEKSKILLGNYHDIIFNFFLLLRKNEKIIIYILNNINNEEYLDILINYFIFFFYDNILDINNAEVKLDKNKDIIICKIIQILIEKELQDININNNNINNYSKFLNNSISSKFIKYLIKLEEIQIFLKYIFYDIIIDILNMDNKNVFMEPNRIRDYLFPPKKLLFKESDNDMDKYMKNKALRKTFDTNKLKKSLNNNKNLRNSMNFLNLKSNGLLLNNNNSINIIKTEPTLSSEYDKSFRETIAIQNYYSNVFFKENEITNLLYNDLTHSRLIYNIKEQKKFFNEDNDENKNINLDEYINLKDKNPDINNDYFTYEFSKKELFYRYNISGKYNKYMEKFYYNQYKELMNDKSKSYSNISFVRSIKNSYQNLEQIIVQYKINFEKIKYFIDKMIYKVLQIKDKQIPLFIKSIVITIHNYLKKNVEKISEIEINGYIFEFFISHIIIPFLTNEEMINIVIGKRIDKETKTFLFYFSKIIKKIFRCNLYDSFDKNYTIFNIYICEILPYINLIILNFLENSKNISIPLKAGKPEYLNEIINHESLIININIIKIILDFLIQNNDKIKSLINNNEDLKQNFNLISENYNDILQQFEEGKNLLNEENTEKIESIENIFLILIKQEISKKNITNKLSLISSENDTDILLKIKYSIIKIFENIPNDYIIIKNKSVLKIFEEMKNFFMKKYLNDDLIENDINKSDDNISFIWFLDFFMKYNNNLNDKYKINDFEKLFDEIKIETNNEINIYQNDLSEYNFNFIINTINEQINATKNLYLFYSKNKFTYIINDYIFNNFNKKIEIYEYEKKGKKYIFLNKLLNNDLEFNYIKNIIINNDIYKFIDYFSHHIIKENAIKDFDEIENSYKKGLSIINNINNFLEDFIIILKDYIIKELNLKKEENGGNDNDDDMNNINNINKEKMEKIIYIIEQIINEEIYKKIWKNQISKEDEELNNLYKNKLSKKIPNDFGIKKKYINEEIWDNIINLMKSKYNINNFKTPMDKIKCVENIYKILNKSLIVITSKNNDYSVDDLFPIFVYLLIQAKPQFLITNLNYIKLLIRKKNLIKNSGFSLTQFEMAIQYIKNME